MDHMTDFTLQSLQDQLDQLNRAPPRVAVRKDRGNVHSWGSAVSEDTYHVEVAVLLQAILTHLRLKVYVADSGCIQLVQA